MVVVQKKHLIRIIAIKRGKSMSLLLEEIVFQAKELGIDTVTDKEKKELLEMWKNKGV